MNFNNHSNDCEENAKKSVTPIWWFEWIPARVVLYLLALCSMGVMYIIRTTITLTILAMVKEKPNIHNLNFTETLCSSNNNSTNVSSNDYGGTLDWSLSQQYFVLTSFYFTYLISHFVSGIVVQKFGSKKTFGWSLVVSSLSQLCVPFSSTVHYILVVILQLIQGLSQGLIWPAVYAAIGVWIPIQERSRFVTCFQGSALGIAIMFMLAGFAIAEFGWVYVFYGTGTLGLLSVLMWYLLMHDKPEQHPRITEKELKYIQENREQRLNSEKTIPWYSILTSFPVWAVAVSAFGRMWIVAIFTTYGPLYFKTILRLSVEKNGLIIGIYKIVSCKLMKLVNNRKMFSVIGQILSGVLLLTMGYVVECNVSLIIAISFLIQTCLMANFVGTMTNIVDISPSYSGPVSSFIQTILLLPTLLSTFVLKTFLQNENNLLAWRHTFSISCGVIIFTAIFFAIFASGKVQPWDTSKYSTHLVDSNTENHLLNDPKPL
ncbi:hypothetical protein FQR65_LT05452 [Abscondita terminalis]|nr:hypothetical protein FQR65_LT05452 [Abscondita terminalis]